MQFGPRLFSRKQEGENITSGMVYEGLVSRK